MAKVTKPGTDAIRVYGQVTTADTRWGRVIKRWPRKKPRRVTPYQFYSRAEFGIAAQIAAHPFGLDYEMAKAWAEGTDMVPRDILMKMALGTFYVFDNPSGINITVGRHLTNNPQYTLDQITESIGAIIYRAEIGWVALLPANDGKVLTMEGALPVWKEAPSGGGGGSSPDFNVPPSTDFPYLVNTPTLTDSVRGLGLSFATTNNQLAAALRNIDTNAVSTYIARLIKQPDPSQNNGFYLVAHDATSGRFMGVGITNANYYSSYIEGTRWYAYNNYYGGYGGNLAGTMPLWVKLEYTLATKTFVGSATNDGVNWVQLFSDNTFLAAPSHIGFAVARRSTTYPNATGGVTYFERP